MAEQAAEGEGAEPVEGEEGEKPATTEGEADIPQVRYGMLVLITTADQHIVQLQNSWYSDLEHKKCQQEMCLVKLR